MSLLDWLFRGDDSQSSIDVIDLYFIETSLVDVRITDAERQQNATYDALCQNATSDKVRSDNGVPVGKRVY